jgi:hypothetical protein
MNIHSRNLDREIKVAVTKWKQELPRKGDFFEVSITHQFKMKDHSDPQSAVDMSVPKTITFEAERGDFITSRSPKQNAKKKKGDKEEMLKVE